MCTEESSQVEIKTVTITCSTGMTLEFEIIETYTLFGKRRWRIRVKGTKIVFNVTAESEDEALEKAKKWAEELELEKVLDVIKESGESGKSESS